MHSDFLNKIYTFVKTHIFGMQEYEQTHYILYLLGFRIKFPKREFYKKKKLNSYYYYKKNNIDITTIPPASGQLRDIQLANLALLKELDYVCKTNNLSYWLDAGTLIGAIRHKGFIPWDDDIDVAMLRDDYEKVIDTFNKTTRNKDFFAGHIRDSRNNYIIKIQHKTVPYLFVDIFPWDTYGKILSESEEITESTILKNTIKNEIKSELNNIELKNKIKEIMGNYLIKPKTGAKCFVWGIDYHHQWKNWFTHYDVLYPIKTITFEGMEFPCMNNPDAFLTRVYGNYMSYPSKITMGHSMYLNISEQDKLIIKELVNQC